MANVLPRFMRSADSSVLLDVVVAPRSSRNAIISEYQGRLKIALNAPPVDGEANEALVAFIAKVLGMPKRNISIQRGTRSKQKTLRVEYTNADEVLRRINLELVPA